MKKKTDKARDVKLVGSA